MNYEEAIKLARNWTTDHDIGLDGWRSVIAVMLQRITVLETTNKNLHEYCNKLAKENDALSLDLGIKEKDFVLPPQPYLKTVADIIKECEYKATKPAKDNLGKESW